MVLLPTEANIDVVPAEASINAAARRRYHWCRCPWKLSLMLTLDKATTSYRYHLKLTSMTMPLLITSLSEAVLDITAQQFIMDTVTNQSYHQCCCCLPERNHRCHAYKSMNQRCRPTKLSLMPPPARAITNTAAHWNFHIYCLSLDHQYLFNSITCTCRGIWKIRQ